MSAVWNTLTIANNTAVSDVLEMRPGDVLVALLTPGTWTAADIVPQLSDDGGTTFYDWRDADGVLIRLTNIAVGAAELRILANDDSTVGPQKVRFRSCNTASEADVNQGGARTIKVLKAQKSQVR